VTRETHLDALKHTYTILCTYSVQCNAIYTTFSDLTHQHTNVQAPVHTPVPTPVRTPRHPCTHAVLTYVLSLSLSLSLSIYLSLPLSLSQGNRRIALCTVVGILEDGETYSTELKLRQSPGAGKMGQWEHELVCQR
jgi:hypothetical protein